MAHQAGATDVVQYFEEHFSGCRILECKLYASKTPRQHVYVLHPPVHYAMALAQAWPSYAVDVVLAAWHMHV